MGKRKELKDNKSLETNSLKLAAQLHVMSLNKGRKMKLLRLKLYLFVFMLLNVGAGHCEEVTKTVVKAHAGKSDYYGNTFRYTPPPGKKITNYEFIELSKNGDANYSVAKSSEKELLVNWSIKSHEIKAAGITIDTKTASLILDVKITLEAIPPPPAPVIPEVNSERITNSISSTNPHENNENNVVNQILVGLFVTIVGGLILFFITRKFHKKPNE